MSEAEPEGAFEHAPITDDELYLTLDERLRSRDFTRYSEAENIGFAHAISSLVCDSFSYLNYAGSQTFDASELPGPLQPLYSTIWSPGGESRLCYVHDMSIRRVMRREEHTETEPYIPGFEEMKRSGMAFDQIIEKLKEDPEIKNKIVPGEVILDEAIVIIVASEYGSEGLEFIVEPDGVILSIFGKTGATRALSQFLVRYASNQNELSKMSSSLAVLGAKYCLRPRHYENPEFHLTIADKKILSGL